MSKIIEQWKNCKEDTLGSLLAKTLDTFLEGVFYADIRKQTRRFASWASQMQQKGHFGQFSGEAPTTAVFTQCLENAEKELKISRDLANAKKWPATVAAAKQVRRMEKLLEDTTFFVLQMMKVLPKHAPEQVSTDASDGKPQDVSTLSDKLRVTRLYPTLRDPSTAPPVSRGVIQAPLHEGGGAYGGQESYSSSEADTSEQRDTPTTARDVWVVNGGVFKAAPLTADAQYIDQTKTFLNSLPTESGDVNSTTLVGELRDKFRELPGFRSREVGNNVHDLKDKTPVRAFQLPLTRAIAGRGQETRTYNPFSLQDVALLKNKLPPLEKGGSTWINEFLKLNAGADLAIGDWRRVFTACSNVSALKTLEEKAGSVNLPDYDPLATVINTLWPTLREMYPLRLNTAELYNLPLMHGEKGATYLQRTREHWENHTGEDPMNAGDNLSLLYRGAVETSLPVKVRGALKRVVGLSAMDFALWSTHVTHYVDMEEDRSVQALQELTDMKGKLVKAQLQQVRQDVQKSENQLTVVPAGYANVRAPPGAYRGRRGGGNPNRQRTRFNNGNCFLCGQFGHWMNACPQFRGRQLHFNSQNVAEFDKPAPYNPTLHPAGRQTVSAPPVDQAHCVTQQTPPMVLLHTAPGERQLPV